MDLDFGEDGRITLTLSGDAGISLALDRARGTTDYGGLTGKPSIEGHTLAGDSTIQQIGVGALPVSEIEKILYL